MTVQPIGYPTDYTSRDYLSIRADLISAIQTRVPAWNPTDTDFAVAITEALAMASDVSHYYIDRLSEEAFLQTAQQRSNVLAIAAMLGYTPAASVPSTATFSVYNPTAGSITLPAGSLIETYITSGVSPVNIPFETNTAITIGTLATQSVVCTQGITVSGSDGTGEYLGLASGYPGDSFTLAQFPVIQNSVKLTSTVGGNVTSWSYVPRLTDYGPFDQVFTLQLQDNGGAAIVFGDGANGSLPPAGATMKSIYRVGGGVQGNIPAGVTSYIASPTTGNIPLLTLTLPTAPTGGIDAESTGSVRVNAPRYYATQNRAVTLSDYEGLALTTPGIYMAKAVASVYSNVTVYVAPNDDGTGQPGFTGTFGAYTNAPNFTTAISTASTSLNSKCPAGTTVTVSPYNPIYVAINADIYLTSATRWSQYLSTLNAALASLLAFAPSDLGLTLYPGMVQGLVYSLPGTVSVTLNAFDRYNPGAAVASTLASGGIIAAANEVLMLNPAVAGVYPGVTITLHGGINDTT